MSTPERSNGEPNLQAKITYAALDRTIKFAYPSPAAAKVGALKAMSAIHIDDGIRSDVQKLDLSSGKGQVHWDYYGFMALKTGIYFDQIEDGRMVVGIDKAYSEGSSLRTEVE